MPTTQTADQPGLRSALLAPAFRRYFYASTFSTFGLWIMRFLLGWTAWDLTQSAFWVGLVSTTMLMPTFVLSPVFGVLTDRINLRTGIVITNGTQVLVGSVAGAAYFAGVLSIEWLLVLALAKGIVTSAHHPMRLAMMPRLIDRHLLPSGIGLLAIVFNSSRIMGPAVGAGLLVLASTGTAFLVSAALFLVSSALMVRLPNFHRQTTTKDDSVWHDLIAGLRFAAANPTIRLLLTLSMINGFLGRTVLELLPAVSGQLLAGQASTLAMLTALAGFGSIVGGYIMSRQGGHERHLARLVMLALIASSLVLAPVLWLQQIGVISTVIFLLSITMTITGTGCQALTQLVVSDQYRGRIMSLWTVITMGTPAIGAFVMGGLADWLGFGPVLAAFSLVALLVTLWLLPQRRNIVESA